MIVDVHDEELAMTIFCSLLSKFEHLIAEIDVVADDEKLKLELVKTRLLWDERQISDSSLKLKLPLNRHNVDSLATWAVGEPFPAGHTERKGAQRAKVRVKYPFLKPGKKNLWVTQKQLMKEKSPPATTMFCVLFLENNSYLNRRSLYWRRSNIAHVKRQRRFQKIREMFFEYNNEDTLQNQSFFYRKKGLLHSITK